MIRTMLRGDHVARHTQAVDGALFPAGGRQRLRLLHPQFSDDDLSLVEAATRQWSRLVARCPIDKLSMPSVIVDRHWREFVLHTEPEPKPATTSRAASATVLLSTLGLAQRDEGCRPTCLPLLFRVDEELRVHGGNRYLIDCGGRGECFEARGMTCLRHLAGLGKRPAPRGIRGDPPGNESRYGYIGGATGF
jgi:hypothetical protein